MAIVLGLVAAYIVRQALQKPVVAARPAPPPVVDPGVPVVYALKSLTKNSRITSRDIFVRMTPRTAKAASESIGNINLVEGRIVKETIRSGRALREEYLLPIGEGLPDLAERLPAGHRAVTINVQGAATGGRRLTEGDYIDISLTVEGDHPDLGEVTTRTLLRKVLIVDAKEDYPKTRGVDRNNLLNRSDDELTVAVTPVDANKLVVAQRTGTLSVSLVPSVEAAEPPPASEDAVTRRQLLGLKEVPPVRKYTLEKWSGGKVTRVEWSDERVREAREMRPGVKQQNVTADDRSAYIPSGVTVPVSTPSATVATPDGATEAVAAEPVAAQ